MTHAHGGLLVALVAFGMGAAVGNGLLLAARWVFPREKLQRLAGARLTRLATVGLCLPLLLAVAAIAAVLVGPTLALFNPRLDHCAHHAGAPHICFTHGTLDWSSGAEALGVAFVLALLLAVVVREFARLARSRAVVHALVGGRYCGPMTTTDDEVPYAFSVGLLRPRIVISAGLRALLSRRQLRVAVAHERAHLRHHDALVRVLTRVASFVVVPPLRRALSELLVLGQEMRADAEAAGTVKSEALVAETLLVMCRRASPQVGLLAPALLGNEVEARVEALCRAPQHQRGGAWLLPFAAAVVVSLLAGHAQVHRAAEAFASTLLSSPVHSHDSSAPSHLPF